MGWCLLIRIDFLHPPDDIDLQETIRDLHAAGSVVIHDLPGQKGSAIQMGCDSILEKKQRKWVVVPI